MAKGGNETFKFASLPCDTLLINNIALLHATPNQQEITPDNISTPKGVIIHEGRLDGPPNETVTQSLGCK